VKIGILRLRLEFVLVIEELGVWMLTTALFILA